MGDVAVLFGGPSPEHDVSVLTGLQAARGIFQNQRGVLMNVRLARLTQVNALRANLRNRLVLLGVRDPDRAIKRGAFLRARHVQVRGLSPRISSVRHQQF